ncbi:hypothetical protein A3C37_03785 [Candidatus Peribacteria bacterium RIFCSPHIGHO2_02_FULL_53_20]|nr:MAG: hypothetical protein A3C37_03785 [Candidatus Peribacteria bacterium RIFCSPHIGHO2_02_FULL_53_20]OGJ68036.1 MAG: hypothetical protein A3B61_00350 [Candidatus Peribacteria bacterium RIFCSPLOWO2_01_FULL_53_10]OGJ73150.1 MAG: hypothetical protein A3G69_05870 [Candidatus Peribacteria bacterium RIFCSPLOWO2_12_FULL_53_10]
MMLRIFLFLALLPSHALAIAWDSRWDKFRDPVAGTGLSLGNNFLNALANGWYNFVWKFIAGASIIAFIWGASTMQGTAWDEGNKENGKKIIIGALVGMVLALLAGSIVHFADSFIDPVNFPVCGSGGGPGCP